MRAEDASRSQEEETIVKVLLINGSPRWKGNTNRALEEAAAALQAEGVETELVWIGNKEIRGGIACGTGGKTGARSAFAEDCCNELIAKAAECDGFIVALRRYYAGMAGRAARFRTGYLYAGGANFRFKPAAGIAGGAPGRGPSRRPTRSTSTSRSTASPSSPAPTEPRLRAHPRRGGKRLQRACTPCACWAATWPDAWAHRGW